MFAAALVMPFLSLLVSIQASVTTWLVLDPTSENRLRIEVPAQLGGPSGTQLVGGVLATLYFDPVALALNLPLSVDVRVEEIRIAGASFAPLAVVPGLKTGTLCVTADPDNPGTGTVTLPLLRLPHIEASMNTISYATGLISAIPDGIPLTAEISDDLQLDLRALLLNRFLAGPVAVDTEAQGVIPPDVFLLGGLPFSLQVKILNSLQPPHHPLLDECAAFLASR